VVRSRPLGPYQRPREWGGTACGTGLRTSRDIPVKSCMWLGPTAMLQPMRVI
jgi:hypothetical protein